MNRENYCKDLLKEIERLNQETISLKQELHNATKSLKEIKAGNIDALVIGKSKDLKIYAEQTADKTYRILIEKMHEGAVMLNAGGTILYCNSHFATMVSTPLQKIIGTKFQTFIDEASDKLLASLLTQTRPSSLRKEVLIYTRDKKFIPVLMSVNSLSLNDNAAFSMILTDLTVQNNNQEELRNRAKQLVAQNIELENANKDLTTFTFLSSHDLQEPLRKIQTFVSILLQEEEGRLSHNGKVYFNKLSESARKMRALIEDLLSYSSAKNSEGNFEKTDLTTMVAEIVKDCEEIMQEKNAKIEADNLGEANIIYLQFRQVIYNLIWNSIKFSKPERAPRIKIKSEVVKRKKLNEELSSIIDYHRITYSDNGIGFEPQYNERVFGVFQRLHSSEKYRGTGMGLAICKRIVENHNGTITASGKLNKGVRFDIYIPVS